jgi:hypothetical protein
VQPATDRTETAAIAPIREYGGVIIRSAKAASRPVTGEMTTVCQRVR